MRLRDVAGLLALVSVLGSASGAAAAVPACHRPAAGSVVQPPADLYSSGGVLDVAFSYASALDAQNRTLLCFVTPDGQENPTLHVQAGDTIHVALTNTLSKSAAGLAMAPMPQTTDRCGAATMLPQSVNLHFHGMNVSPHCHADEVIRTLVNPGESFSYTIKVPADEPPGLYWYHPHVHGLSHLQLEAGASGAIEVEGIASVVPSLANLPQRTLILRDQTVDPKAVPGKREPTLDLTLNDVPVAYPVEQPATIEMGGARAEFWRFLNASADGIAVLQVKYDGVVQTLGLAAVDGVALGSQDGTRHGHVQNVTSILVPPGGRAEFTLVGPGPGTRHATLTTLKPDNGPAGDADPERVLAVIRTPYRGPALPVLSAAPDLPGKPRFEGLDQARPTATRHLYFSEILTDPNDQGEGLFYITVAGQIPALFDPNAPPSIVTKQGAVEDWVIQNQTNEVHEFHIHQIHFQLRAVNGKPVPQADRLIQDTIQVPYWSGHGPYPSVTLRLDFRGDVVGDFVYHCHILDHEDSGMMQIVRVLPKDGK